MSIRMRNCAVVKAEKQDGGGGYKANDQQYESMKTSNKQKIRREKTKWRRRRRRLHSHAG